MPRLDVSRWSLPVALVLLSSACSLLGTEESPGRGGGDSPAAGEAPASAPPGPAASAGAPESKAAAAGAAAGAGEVGTPSKAGPEAGAVPEPSDEATLPTFTPVLAGNRTYPRLHPLADGNLLLSVGPQIYVVEDGKPLREDPALLAGLPAPLCPVDGEPEDWLWDLDLTGRWPDALFASVWVAAPPNAPPIARRTFRRRDGAFAPLELGGGDSLFYYVDARPYVDGSLLSLRRFQALPPKGIRMSECNEDDPATVRQCEARFSAVGLRAESSKALLVTRGLPKGPDVADLLGRAAPILATFDSLSSGHVFAATAFPPVQMLVVTPGHARLDALPGPTDELRIHAVRAYAPDRVFAAGGTGDPDDDPVPRLYHYDGRTWTALPSPPCEMPTELWYFDQLASGERFALCIENPEEEGGNPYDARSVWWQPPGGDWIELPQKATAIARHGEHMWAADFNGVSTTAPATTVLTATPREALERTLLAKGPRCLGLEKTW